MRKVIAKSSVCNVDIKIHEDGHSINGVFFETESIPQSFKEIENYLKALNINSMYLIMDLDEQLGRKCKMKDISEIPADPTNEQVAEVLNTLTQAMCNLSAIWGNANDEQDNALCNKHFPIPTDFDEFMHRMIDWAWEAKEILKQGAK